MLDSNLIKYRIANLSAISPRKMLICILVTLICCAAPQGLEAQDVVVVPSRNRYPYRIRWAVYDPYFAVTSRVYAQYDLIRAQGDAAVSFSAARLLNAEAYSRELDNWGKELRAYWDRKTEAEQLKMERNHARQIARMRYLNDQKWQNSRFWERLKDHPELSDVRIRNGDALNFLLARLAASSLPYEFDSQSSRYGQEALQQLDLDEQWLAHLTLKQGPFKFPANQSVDRTISLWPYILRWEEFNAARSALEDARAAVVKESESQSQASVASIQRMQKSLLTLTNEFHSSSGVKHWVKQHHRYAQFYSADRFLQELDREIARLEQTGDIRVFRGQSGYDPKTDGDHVISLLCFMNRNGLEFAAAKPGSEHAYHNLFVLMRSLYLTVAEEDEGVNPKNPSDMMKS